VTAAERTRLLNRAINDVRDELLALRLVKVGVHARGQRSYLRRAGIEPDGGPLGSRQVNRCLRDAAQAVRGNDGCKAESDNNERRDTPPVLVEGRQPMAAFKSGSKHTKQHEHCAHDEANAAHGHRLPLRSRHSPRPPRRGRAGTLRRP
jgi:hypothetical protein